ncbi:hypothetical protein Hhel01_02532 [Haloferula helveola]
MLGFRPVGARAGDLPPPVEGPCLEGRVVGGNQRLVIEKKVSNGNRWLDGGIRRDRCGKRLGIRGVNAPEVEERANVVADMMREAQHLVVVGRAVGNAIGIILHERAPVVIEPFPTEEARDVHELGMPLELVGLLTGIHGHFTGREREAEHPRHGGVVQGAVGVAEAERSPMGGIDVVAECPIQHRRLEQVHIRFTFAAEFRKPVGMPLLVKLNM